ncbi:MAG: LytR/AlgR family response regulator transcription factor [Bacteroidia bacterium]
MLKGLIVEDEKNSQMLLKTFVTEYCEGLEIVAIAGSVKEALAAIEKYSPDVVFQDIELPDGDGFQVLEKTPNLNFDIIFTTAYDQYALKAFKFAATDYLLKPIDVEELQNAVKRVVEKRAASPERPNQKERVEVLMQQVRHPHQAFKRIVLPTATGFTVVNPDDIIRCESDRNYTYIFLADKRKILVSRTIKDYEEMLEEHNFFRIHQSHLINLNCLKNYIRGRGGSVELTDGTIIDVSARRKADFMRRLSMAEDDE